jgi:hypothetical protein
VADIPKTVDVATSAVAHVVSKIVPERFHSYLAVFLPGLFFEISLLVGNPALVSGFHDQLERSFAFGSTTIVLIALFLAFVIGNGFMLIPGLIVHFFFEPVCKVWWFLWRRLCVWPLKRIDDWLLSKPRLVQIPEVLDFHRYVIDLGFKTRPDEAQSAWHCWVTVATRLVSKRYGIKPQDLNDDHQWGVMYWILGVWKPEDTRGSLLMIATEATGWAGLMASRIAPALRNRYYFYFVGFLVGMGLLHDLYVARRTVDPRMASYAHVRAVMRELRQIPDREGDAKPAEETDE